MILTKKDNLSLWHYIMECGECEEGGRLKHDMVDATMFLDVTAERAEDELDDDRELAGVLAMYVGKRLTIDGYTTAYDGFETYGEEINVLEERRETRVVTTWVHAAGPTIDPERKLLDIVPVAMSTAKELS